MQEKDKCSFWLNLFLWGSVNKTESRRQRFPVQSAGAASCPSGTPCWLCGFLRCVCGNSAESRESQHPSVSHQPLQPQRVTEKHLEMGQGKDQLKWAKESFFFFFFFPPLFCFSYFLVCSVPLFPTANDRAPELTNVSATHVCTLYMCLQGEELFIFFYHNSHDICCIICCCMSATEALGENLHSLYKIVSQALLATEKARHCDILRTADTKCKSQIKYTAFAKQN